MHTHLAPGQLLLAAKGDDNGKLTRLQVFLCANKILFAAVSCANSHLEILTPSFPGAVRAGALDGGLLQLHCDCSVPETLREEVLTLAERTRE